MHPVSPTEPDEHTERQIRMCAEMADLAYQLARATAAKTMEDAANPPPASTAPPQSAPPQSAPTQPCPQLLFASLARIMLACLAAEKRLTSTAAPPPRRAQPAGRRPSVPRPPIPEIAALQGKLAALAATPIPRRRSVIPALMREMSKHTGLSLDLPAPLTVRKTAPNDPGLGTPPPVCRPAG